MNEELEHFVTLHDAAFMPIGLCLYSSLVKYAPNAHLTVVCMDDESHEIYQRLGLPNLTAISPNDWLDDNLRKVKSTRNRREFCWTMASHSYNVAWQCHPEAKRMTYLDADLCFFSDPTPLIIEMLAAGKEILVTEHAYDPRYDQSTTSGIYCVQFLTFCNTATAKSVLENWQQQCLESCSENQDGVTFGDQMYLNTWPQLYADIVHVCKQPFRTLAPWNVDFFQSNFQSLEPIFFHFHSLRLTAPGRVLAWEKYRIGARGREFYWQYFRLLNQQLQLLNKFGYSPRYLRPGGSIRLKISTFIRSLLNIDGQRTYMKLADACNRPIADS